MIFFNHFYDAKSIMECMICLFNADGVERIRCCNPQCMSYVCENCMYSYIDICVRENQSLKCPSPSCTGEYDYASVHGFVLDKQLLVFFLNYITFRAKYIEHVDLQEKKTELIQTIREERMKFFNELPVAIAKVARIGFGPRIKKIQKQQFATIDQYTRPCMNLFCRGYLNKDNVCSKCHSQLCVQCEEKMEKDHVCREEDIESVKMKNSFVRCPKCKTPVERSSGCPSMTCTICNENFVYTTGQSGGSGNSHNTPIVQKHTVFMSVEYASKIPPIVMKHVQLLEKMRDSKCSVTLKSLVKECIDLWRFAHNTIRMSRTPLTFIDVCTGDELHGYLQEFAKQYSTYIRHSHTISIAIKKLMAIQSLLDKNDIHTLCSYYSAKILINKIEIQDGLTILDEIERVDTVSEASKVTNISEYLIKHALYIGDGKLKNFQFEYII